MSKTQVSISINNKMNTTTKKQGFIGTSIL